VSDDITVTAKGPLFDLRREGIIARGMENAVSDVVEHTKDIVEEHLVASLVNPTGYYESKLRIHKTASSHATLNDSGVVYGPWLERGGYFASTGTRFRGYSSFRRAVQKVKRTLKKLADPAIHKMARELS
jgi:hypothetical protein